ncbi:hypothetical protein N7U66_20045 [Lacinutrix neustonica]|uniref:Uncharacterized protein n=1 Tax=Lacinutrix neustonica TaxID=2980107 RepID=A0A9E8SE91_9FLAO|nr:hypothetical protein [Lacinutrix neustonica]WAC02059.1 hypothetical protein N7U66_20045 [Lacinutrix neustonica]
MKHKPLNKNNHSGFKVPKNYFQDFDATILAEAKLKNSVSNSGFKTPDNYIASFKSVALDSKQREAKVISLFNKKNMLLFTSVAATVVLFFNIDLFNKATFSVSDLDTDTVDNYILDEIEITELAALFAENELNETQFIDYSISDETLDSYLESVEGNELFSE